MSFYTLGIAFGLCLQFPNVVASFFLTKFSVCLLAVIQNQTKVFLPRWRPSKTSFMLCPSESLVDKATRLLKQPKTEKNNEILTREQAMRLEDYGDWNMITTAHSLEILGDGEYGVWIERLDVGDSLYSFFIFRLGIVMYGIAHRVVGTTASLESKTISTSTFTKTVLISF